MKHWTAFWDSFQSAVHNNDDIPKVDKFNYLNSLLEGAAFKTIQGLTLSKANYNAAVSMLKERFGNPQQIISAHIEGCLRSPTVQGTDLLHFGQCMTKLWSIFEVLKH